MPNLKHDSHPFFLFRSQPEKLPIDAHGHWSYPAFVRDSGRIHWLFVILPYTPMAGKNHTALFKPKAVLVLDPKSLSVVRYENFRLGSDPFSDAGDEPVALFPHQAIGGMTYQQLEEDEQKLLSLYENAQRSFCKEGQLSETFIRSYLTLQHPVFLLYLRLLTPEFASALDLTLVNNRDC